MAGTDIYDVCIVFSVHADNDDDALNKVRSALNYGNEEVAWDLAWSWIYTTQTNKGDANE